MTKRTVEIDDTLQDRVDTACDELKDILTEYLDSNPNTEELPDLGNDIDYDGRFHEMVDSNVPVYTSEQNDIFYLHGQEVEEAFDDAGIGDKDDSKWPCGWRAAAIYCYIEQECREWWDENAQGVFDEWKETHDATNRKES